MKKSQNTMKIWYIVAVAALLAVCLICMILALTLTGDKYFELIYDEFDGVTYIGDISSGAQVKDGTVVTFSIQIDSNKVEGEPVVKTNDQFVLTPDENGKYSFTMKRDTTVKVDNIFAVDKYEVTFDGSSTHTRFVSEQGNTDGAIAIKAGETISFKVIKSVYCVGDPIVLANTTIIEPNAQGVYSFAVTEKTNVTVTGIETEEPFYRRENGGDGTRTNPYKLSRPIDLYAVADLIANSFYTDVKFAYYELTADIDLNGEQLYIIGDATTETSLFAGHFNGNGHTVSNFFIEDYIIEQSAYTTVKLPYVGMFGYVSSTVYGPAEISNLHVKDFKIVVDRLDSAKEVPCCIGGIAGYVGGASITGCTAQGEIVANTSDEKPSYIGGIVGVIESITMDSVGDFSASVRSCSSDTEIICEYGYVFGGGGIVGYAKSASEKNPCTVYNSYSTGNIEGAVHAGGIVGRCAEYTSVLNSYSTGDVSAISFVPESDTIYATSYGGGIVGYMETGGIVANSFALGNVFAESVNGTAYTDPIIGGKQLAENSNLHDADAYDYNCYSSASAGVTFNEQFYKNVLKWEDSDWVFDGNDHPAINFESTTITYTINVNFVENKEHGAKSEDAYSVSVSDTYMPVAFWNYQTDGLPEFFDWNGLRSYGYYFDEGLTKKVPYSFVPTGDITLYAGFADYTEVEGRYFVKTNAPGSGIYVQLDANGTLTMREGAQSCVTYFTYDGETIRLYDNELLTSKFFGSGYVLSFVGMIDQIYGAKELVVYNRISILQSVALFGAKELDGFAYGVYYKGNSSFEFNTDGSVVINGTGNAEFDKKTFAYYPGTENNTLVIVRSDKESENILVTLANGAVSSIQGLVADVEHIDGFKGTWERPIAAHMQYTFDGKNVWKYECFIYNADGDKVTLSETLNGTYSVDQNGVATMLLDGSPYGQAAFEDGNLKINGEAYFNSESYLGVWLFNGKSPIEIKLQGIGQYGFGEATVNYGGRVGILDANYEISDGKLYLFNGLTLLGEFAYSDTTKTLDGKLYVITPDGVSASYKENIKLCLYDNFKGVWVSNDSTLSLVEFNGLGVYDLKGSADYLAIRGNILINGISVGMYNAVDGTLKGSFEYNSTTYTIEYDWENNRIIVNESVYLVERDSLYGLELIDEDGNKYSFDGRSNTADGGKFTVNDETEYTYRIQGNSIVITGAQNGSITMDGFVLTMDGGSAIPLFLNGDFEGNWIIGGTVDGTMTLGKVGANGKTRGTFMGENVVFTYDRAKKTLSFDWNDSTVTVKAHILEADGITELSVTMGTTTYICMRGGDDAYLDEYKGVYTGENSVIVLDGFLYSRFGGGTALIIYENGDTYSIPYQIDIFGQIAFIREGVTYDIMIESANGEFVGENSKKYDLLNPDIMYRRTVTGLKEDHEEIDENAIYLFDGVGGVYNSSNEQTYTYELKEQTEQDRLDLVFRAVFTDVKTGKKYEAVINYGNTDYTLYLTEITDQEA